MGLGADTSQWYGSRCWWFCDTDYYVRTFLRRWVHGHLCHQLSHLGPKDAKVTSLAYLVGRGKEYFGLLFCADLSLVGELGLPKECP